ncbi:MFS transporter [Actinomadura rupiterrae]|uniref:MFS transporter n=1 Tax=Actinomadura rupiterrae TaxID=559627 RepID=UPI0020A45934|nr:MFS transporter [Actinomadura rupiterrae]MCP2340215.1 putative MFS family arabinose efflux permease [Actinomadura rupiterrae]
MIAKAPLVVAAGTFTIVTTEMLPVGLLPPLAHDLHVSEGAAGLAVMLPGVVAAASALAVALGAGRLDRRVLLCSLAALLAVANVVSAVAPSLGVLLAARVLVGVAIGGFWAIAASLAPRLVPERQVGTATAVIFGGIAVASVVGVPAGAFIAQVAGWRASFAVMAALALAVLVLMAVALPPLPATSPFRVADLPAVLRLPTMRVGLALTALIVVGHFAAYTYVRPVLEQIGGVRSALIGPMLLAYGLAGIAGNFLAGRTAVRSPRLTLLTQAVAIALVTVVLAATPVPPILPLLIWGIAYGGVSVSLQTLLSSERDAPPEAASSLLSSSFNASIALGALVGGQLTDGPGLATLLYTASVLTAGAALLAVATFKPSRVPATR